MTPRFFLWIDWGRLDASVRINLPSPVTSPTALVRGMSQKAMDSKSVRGMEGEGLAWTRWMTGRLPCVWGACLSGVRVVRMASQTGKQAKKEVQGTLKLVRRCAMRRGGGGLAADSD